MSAGAGPTFRDRYAGLPVPPIDRGTSRASGPAEVRPGGARPYVAPPAAAEAGAPFAARATKPVGSPLIGATPSAGLRRGLPSRDGEPPPGRPRAVPQVRRTPGKGSQARTTVVADDGMMAQVSGRDGFIAALDQSGGATPGALRLYGVPDSAYGGDAEMF